MSRNGDLPKYCSWLRHKYIFFQRGKFSTYLTGVPWSEDFMRQYADALRNKKRFREKIIDKFWDYVDKSSGPNKCWLWTKHIDANGYGRAVPRQKGNSVLAHRHAWSFTYGPISKGLHVLHLCDNPACCNPRHLYLGTHQDNMNDRNRKGRFHHILTEKNVRRIRTQRAAGKSATAIGNDFGISHSHVSHICARRIWKHVV